MRIRGFHRAQAALVGILTVTATALITAGGSATAQAAVTTGCSVTVNKASVTMKVSKPGTSAKCRFTVPSPGYSLPERVSAAVTNLVTSDGSDCATLTLLAPNGSTVDSSYNCNSVGVGPDPLTASGTYTLRLTLFSNTATGTATLTVSAPKSLGTVAINGPPVAMNVNRVGQEVYYTFTATAGERVTETLTNLVTSDGSNCATLTLLAHNGSTVDSSYNCNSVGVGPDTLASGTYTVRLTLFSNTATGTATLNVSA